MKSQRSTNALESMDVDKSHVRNLLDPIFLKCNFLLLQNVRAITGVVDEVGEMVLQRFFVAGLVDEFEDFDDDVGVAAGVEVDFLVVGDFADRAVLRSV